MFAFQNNYQQALNNLQTTSSNEDAFSVALVAVFNKTIR